MDEGASWAVTVGRSLVYPDGRVKPFADTTARQVTLFTSMEMCRGVTLHGV